MSRALSRSSPAAEVRALLAAKRHFLFDLDGTLVDSSAAHERAYREALVSADHGLRFDYEQAKGKRTIEVLRQLGVTEPSLLAALVEKKQAAYLAHVERGAVRLFDGARQLLDRLAATGRGCFLATGASRRSTDRVLRSCGIEGCFTDTVTADDVLRGKPSGDCFELLLRRWRLPPADCLVVEDAESGVEAARAAGVEVAVVHNPALRVADASFADLDALLAAVEGSP
ncbi:MAG: HAD family hydrolase [Myxococcales bacterium]